MFAVTSLQSAVRITKARIHAVAHQPILPNLSQSCLHSSERQLHPTSMAAHIVALPEKSGSARERGLAAALDAIVQRSLHALHLHAHAVLPPLELLAAITDGVLDVIRIALVPLHLEAVPHILRQVPCKVSPAASRDLIVPCVQSTERGLHTHAS